jgi:catechol 2,3-dioxygenase-like lactoylglutathione lyase family enzyme
MKLRGVHHVSLNVHDVAETGRFYVEVLGLERLPRPDFGVPGLWLRCEEQEIHLIEVESHRAPEGQHFALRVDDLDAALAELSRRGVKASAPFRIPGGGRQSFIRDPAGNLIELNEPDA